MGVFNMGDGINMSCHWYIMIILMVLVSHGKISCTNMCV